MKKILFTLVISFIITGCTLLDKPKSENFQASILSSEAVEMAEAMKDFPCHQMGGVWMGQCDFDESGELILDKVQKTELPKGDKYDASTEDLPYAKSPIMVRLSDGDSFDLSAGFVKQEVGGRTLRRLAYNGMIPGPIFQVSQGSTITLNFKNEIDEETTIHSHGLRGDYKMDGVPNMPHPAVKPGESFTYELEFPDSGVFWYHPHVREDRQQDAGLYGNYIVEPSTPGYWSPNVREEAWILDDLSLEDYLKDTVTHAIMGRFGSIQMINNEEAFTSNAKAQETVRYLVTNTANVRPFRLKIEGAQMKVVGGDLGRIEHERMIGDAGITIGPAERWIVEVYYPKEGSYEILNNTPDGIVKLGTVIVKDRVDTDTKSTFKTLRDNSGDFEELREYVSDIQDKKSDKRLRIDIDMPDMPHDMQHVHGQIPPIEWNDQMENMNRISTDHSTTWKLIDEDTEAVNEEIDWHFEEGERVVIDVYNDPNTMHPMQHPLHFHGQRFVVLERDGLPNSSLQWKDTVLIKTGERVKILLENTTPGIWMAHCHISEHMHAGMMFNFTVGDYHLPNQNHNH